MTGFDSNSSAMCTDIDECRKSPCDDVTICVNTIGSFVCSNECETGSHDCHENADCRITKGVTFVLAKMALQAMEPSALYHGF